MRATSRSASGASASTSGCAAPPSAARLFVAAPPPSFRRARAAALAVAAAAAASSSSSSSSPEPPRYDPLSSTPPPPPPPKLPPPPTLFLALAFTGPGPELVNARLARLGLLFAARAEAETGRGAAALLLSPPAWALGVAALFALATLAPILKGVRHEAFGPFTPRAEYWNGRAAMVGWASLLALEATQGGAPFF